MANFCLPNSAVNKFTDALRSGKIDPYKLNQMTSEERHKLFEDIVGKAGAKQVNSEFETKMLLKNQKYAYTNWAKSVAGIKEPARRDLVAKIARLDHALSPDEEHGFLKDLASTKLGANVTEDEARTIVKLSKATQEAEAATRSTIEQASKKGWEPTQADLNYGRARYDLEKYVGDLKGSPRRLHIADFKSHPLQATKKLPKAVADVSKSIGASLDDSFALRQGSKAFWTDFPRWQKEFRASFGNLVKGAKNADAAEREINARIMADPHYDQAVKDGLAVRNVKSIDDVFPTSAPGRVPGIGRAFNASEVAYSAFADNLRMGIYKNQLKLADDLGEGLSPEVRKNIAREVNSLTGRGSFGKREAIANDANIAFYSLRFLKSNIDTLLLHPAGIGVGGIGSQAQKTAAKNLLKIIGGTAAVLGTANALKPGSVEWDPRSSDFGKIKIGDTRFEVTGGLDSLVTLASRLVPTSGPAGRHPYTKSSTSKALTQENTGKFGSQSTLDTLMNFIENKTSPVGGVAIDVAKGKTHSNTKPGVGNESGSLVEPLNVKNFTELKGDKNSANILTAVLADTLGISTNTYKPTQGGKPQFSGKVAQTAKSAGYEPNNPAKKERGIKLNATQYTKFTNQANSNFSQAVQKAQSDPTFHNYSKDEKKVSLAKTMTAARQKALDQMKIKKPAPKHSPKVKSY